MDTGTFGCVGREPVQDSKLAETAKDRAAPRSFPEPQPAVLGDQRVLFVDKKYCFEECLNWLAMSCSVHTFALAWISAVWKSNKYRLPVEVFYLTSKVSWNLLEGFDLTEQLKIMHLLFHLGHSLLYWFRGLVLCQDPNVCICIKCLRFSVEIYVIILLKHWWFVTLWSHNSNNFTNLYLLHWHDNVIIFVLFIFWNKVVEIPEWKNANKE